MSSIDKLVLTFAAFTCVYVLAFVTLGAIVQGAAS